MTKAELIQEVATKSNLKLQDAETIINQVFDSIQNALERGDRVEIRGFGAWSIRKRESYMGRNPKTGDAVKIPPKRMPFFKAGKELRERVDCD